jgi:hypothetical protein
VQNHYLADVSQYRGLVIAQGRDFQAPQRAKLSARAALRYF